MNKLLRIKGYFMGAERLFPLLILLFGLLVCGLPLPADAAGRMITSHGQTYVPLKNIAASYSMEISASASDRVRLRNKWHTLEFETGGRRSWIDGTLVWLSNPVREISGKWVVEELDFNKCLDPSIRPYAFLAHAGSRTVVLDPGHGGKDKGAVSPRNVYEKLVVLDVAKRVRNQLQARGIHVQLTRERDHFIALSDRCRKAAAMNADLFVSIHANSAGDNRTVQGIETFVLALPGRYSSNAFGRGNPPTTVYSGNKFDFANAALGRRIQKNLVEATGREDRGVKRARFQVLREAPCPAVLVETAFLSNPREESVVIDADGREKIARGIANGILAYLQDVQRAKKQ